MTWALLLIWVGGAPIAAPTFIPGFANEMECMMMATRIINEVAAPVARQRRVYLVHTHCMPGSGQ